MHTAENCTLAVASHDEPYNERDDNHAMANYIQQNDKRIIFLIFFCLLSFVDI